MPGMSVSESRKKTTSFSSYSIIFLLERGFYMFPGESVPSGVEVSIVGVVGHFSTLTLATAVFKRMLGRKII